jgi:hypothetical protein
MHNELWIPAAELSTFNTHIVGEISIVKVFFGEGFLLPEHSIARQQILKFKK